MCYLTCELDTNDRRQIGSCAARQLLSKCMADPCTSAARTDTLASESCTLSSNKPGSCMVYDHLSSGHMQRLARCGRQQNNHRCVASTAGSTAGQVLYVSVTDCLELEPATVPRVAPSCQPTCCWTCAQSCMPLLLMQCSEFLGMPALFQPTGVFYKPT
jgi:hypothetical protein